MDIYQHYRQDERPFIDQIFEWIQTVKETYAFKLTDFLDPRQQEIVTQIVNYDGEVKAYIYGGPEWTERKRAIISPDYFEPELSDFQLSLHDALPISFNLPFLSCIMRLNFLRLNTDNFLAH